MPPKSERDGGARADSQWFRATLLCVAALLASTASPGCAQTSRAGSFEVTLGPSRSWSGGRYHDETSFSATAAVVADHRGPGIAGFAVGIRPSATNSCLLVPGSDRCAAQLPSYLFMAAAFGREAITHHATCRATIGPAFYFAGLPAYGARAQVDAAAGLKHLRLVLAGRGDLIRHKGETLRVGALEIGLRLQ